MTEQALPHSAVVAASRVIVERFEHVREWEAISTANAALRSASHLITCPRCDGRRGVDLRDQDGLAYESPCPVCKDRLALWVLVEGDE
jgi:hypothetical protein